jgi:hypothetical protein
MSHKSVEANKVKNTKQLRPFLVSNDIVVEISSNEFSELAPLSFDREGYACQFNIVANKIKILTDRMDEELVHGYQTRSDYSDIRYADVGKAVIVVAENEKTARRITCKAWIGNKKYNGFRYFGINSSQLD